MIIEINGSGYHNIVISTTILCWILNTLHTNYPTLCAGYTLVYNYNRWFHKHTFANRTRQKQENACRNCFVNKIIIQLNCITVASKETKQVLIINRWK